MKFKLLIPIVWGISTLFTQAQPSGAVKIPIEGKRWYQLTNATWGLEGLFDGITNVRVETGWGKIIPNYDAYYSLETGETLTLQAIKFFDWEGTLGDYPMTVSVITNDGEKKQVGMFTGSEYNTWVGPYPDRTGPNKFNLDTAVSNVRFIVLNCWYQFPTEIEFYGQYTPSTIPNTPPIKKAINLGNMFGVNAFEWDFESPYDPFKIDEARMKAVKNFTGVRHYMDWEKLESHEGSYTYSPVHSGGWNYDTMYQRCKTDGIEVLACLKTLPGWMQQTYPEGMRDSENTPMRYGKNPADPWSYIEQAKTGFQYMARYGFNKNVDTTLLSVNRTPRWTADEINSIKVGMGVIKYIECDNERDKWWKGRQAYQTAFEYAANLSAFYDGHKGTMGPGVGVKNADPTVKVVMGGLALASTEYVRAMIDWCKINRGFKADGSVNLCWDIINYHLYSNDTQSSQNGNPTRGAAPEKSNTEAVAKDFVAMAHKYANDMPVWVTELGYDINQGSAMRAIPIGSKPAAITQADWSLRSALLYERAGVERIFFYQLYDDNAESPGWFSSMGLMNTNMTRRPVADFLMQTNKLLGKYHHVSTLNQDPLVDRYELDGNAAFALVIPDEIGRTATYNLSLAGADSAMIYTPKAGQDSMSLVKVVVTNYVLPVIVSETPVFIIPFNKPPVTSTGGNGNSGSNGNGKKKTKETLVTTTGTEQFTVYPNPARSFIRVDLDDNYKGKVVIRLLETSSGKPSKTFQFNKTTVKQVATLDLRSVPMAMYTLEVIEGKNSRFIKILKVHD